MAYITDYTYASNDSNVSSHTGSLPIYDVGDLLVWIVHKDSSTGSHLTTPSGWTTLYSGSIRNEMGAFWKFAVANETAPNTSSSDTDAYQSSMFAIKGADQTTPLSAIDTIQDLSTYAYTSQPYYTPANTAVGNLHFAWVSASGVGGCSIESFGKRYINDESTSVAMVIHVKSLVNLSTPTNIDVAQHTSIGFVQFEVIDDGNNITDADCHNDLSVIELATDGMINGSTLGNSTLTTLNGLNVLNPASITQSAGDTGFYPIQKAPQMKEVKSADYTAFELVLASAIDLSTVLLSFDAYPYKPKYQLTIGRLTEGRFIYLMDGSGNYKAFNIDASDNKLLNFAMQFTYILDPQATPFASSGTLDLTAITKIGFGERSRTIICYMSFNRLQKFVDSTIIGGNATLNASFDTLLEHQGGSYFRPNLLQGNSILIQVPIEIGDGSTDVYFRDSGKVLEYPAPYNPSKHDYLFHQRPTRSGINFNLTTNSSVLLDTMVIESESEWYFSSSNSNGTITIKNTTLRGSGSITLTSSMTFDNVVFDKNSMIDGSLDIQNSFFSNPKGSYLIDLSNIATFKNNKFESYASKTALYIPASITDITLDNVTFDGSGTDIYWAGTSGTLNVTMTNGTNITTTSTAGGTINLITNPVTTLITVKNLAGDVIVGARVYLVAGSGGDLAQGTVIFNTTTDSNGQVSNTQSFTQPQPVVGRVRDSSVAPFYKTVPINETIDNNYGLTLNVAMVLDQ